MKKYQSPDILLFKLEIDQSIANLEQSSSVDFDNGSADKDSFENLFG